MIYVHTSSDHNIIPSTCLQLTKSPSSSGSSVFVGILVSGLLAAVAITVGYFKCQRRATTKGVRLVSTCFRTAPTRDTNLCDRTHDV